MPSSQILIFGKFPHIQSELAELDCEVLYATESTRDEFYAELGSKYKNIDVILRENAARHFYGLDAEFVSRLPKSVKGFAIAAAGYEDIDLDAFTKRNIWVTNTRDVVNDSTADTGLFLLLGCLRNFWPSQVAARQGQWRTKTILGHNPKNKVLGIVGLGGIGKAFAKRANALGMNIQYNSRNRVDRDVETALQAEYVAFDTLLSTSDVIFIAVPLNASTTHLIGKKEIAQMNKGVIIVNISRGKVLDEAEVVAGLESGHIASVGLDVYENEPEIHPGLIAHERSVLLPHLGTTTEETMRDMELLALQNAISLLQSQKPVTPVNQLTANPSPTPAKTAATTFDEAEEASDSVEPQSGESAFWMISRNPKRASRVLSQLDFSDLEIKLN